MKFVLQHNLMSAEQLAICKDALTNIPHLFVGVIPFSHEITSDEPLIGQDFIPYGSTLFTNIAYDLKWKGLHFDLNTFNYGAAIQNRDDMLNEDLILKLSAAITFLRTRPENDEWFIRPSEDLKQFSGQVIQAKECADWLTDAMNCDSSGSYHLSADTMVVLAEPRNIQAEWRWFIVDGKIVDGAMYRFNNQLVKKHELEADVIAEAQQLADGWLPDSCCVMDTALVDDKLYVVEFNTINSSGMYNHDTRKIFTALYNFHL